jgi:hypothetical protein
MLSLYGACFIKLLRAFFFRPIAKPLQTILKILISIGVLFVFFRFSTLYLLPQRTALAISAAFFCSLVGFLTLRVLHFQFYWDFSGLLWSKYNL